MPHYKILVIDYEPRGVAQLRDPLHAAGYLVSVANDGVSGMKQFEELEPDLTLIEAMLPKKHGFEVCRDLKKTPHGAKSPVVIVTSVYRGRKYRTQAFHNYNCDEFLEKPISATTLLSVVERLLQDRPLASAEPAAASAPKPVPAPVVEVQPEVEVEPKAKAKPKPKPKAEAKPKPKAKAKPKVEPKPEPKPAAAVAAPAVEDEAEMEISERLDDLFGDGPDPGPQASAASAPDGENILSFDPARGRSTTVVADATTVPGGPGAHSAGRGPATAEAIQAAHVYQPKRDQSPSVAPKARPKLRDRGSRVEPVHHRPTRRGRLLLLLTILIVAGASSAIFLLLNWPF